MTARRISCLVAVAALVALGAPLVSSAAARRPEIIPHGNCGDVFAVRWEHGSANYVNTHGVSCTRAKHVIRYALNHGLLAPSDHAGAYFELRRRRVLGFTFRLDPSNNTALDARKGAARLSFAVCWLNVDC